MTLGSIRDACRAGMRPVRRLGPLVVALAAFLVATAGGVAGDPPKRPRLVLFVSVDQMRYDYLERFAPLFEAGFKRLLAEGAVFTNARYRHANCETGPGHAVLLSGRHASDNGIVANSWYDRTARKRINVVDDPAVSPLPGPGRGASPANFLGQTIGDLLKAASPASRVVGVSLKDRAAILMAGPHADAAYWYEPMSGRFGSSTYYMRTLPAWLTAWNDASGIDSLRGAEWTRLLPDEGVYRHYAGPDDVRGEWDNVDTVFPHRIRGAPATPEFYDDVRRTPFADEKTLEVALLAAREHDLGTDDATDILAVGFSGTDTIGHTYGPDSQEEMDELLRLDRLLGQLIDAMEQRTGAGRLLLGLSADHGVMPLVENLQAQGKDARRVRPDALSVPVREALAARYPAGAALIADFDEGRVTLDRDAVASQGLERGAVEATIADALMATGLVERVYTASKLAGPPAADDPYASFFQASFFPGRSADVVTLLKQYTYMDERYLGGTGHGTPYEYDRHVPVAFMGPAIRPGRDEADAGPEDIAPTLAQILGLDYRLDPGQRVLREALEPSTASLR